MRNFKNNHRRNRFRKNGSNQGHHKDNGHKSVADFSNNLNYRPRNQWKNNQNASKLIEKYTNLAREALSGGDKILYENYMQHAEHFVRLSENFSQSSNSKNNSNSNIDQSKISKINNNDTKEEKQVVTDEN